MSQSRDLPDRISNAVFLIAIAGAPLPFGSRDAVTVAIWCFLLGLGLLLASPRALRSPHHGLLAGIALLAACYAFVLHEQLSSRPWIAVANPIWTKVAELLGGDVTPSASIIRGEPFYALGPQLANTLALVLGIIVGTDRRRADRALHVMLWAGAVYAVYGIGNVLFDPTALLWHERTANVGSLTATFVNRNTAATYFGSCAAAWLVVALGRFRGRLPAGPIVWRQAIRQIPPDMTGDAPVIMRFVLFFVCLVAMFMTGSRGGAMASLFSMVVATVLFFHRDLPRTASLGVLFACVVAIAWGLLRFLGGNVEARVDVSGLADQGRLESYRSALRMIADYPWFGTGLGTFASAFPAYRSEEISIMGVWDVAHSTPLELAVELGIPLTLAITVAWIVALIVLLRGTNRSRRETVVPLAALAVALIALLHSSIDFSLQVSGYAIVVFALTGMGLAQSFPTVASHHRRKSRLEVKGASSRLVEADELLRYPQPSAPQGLNPTAVSMLRLPQKS